MNGIKTSFINWSGNGKILARELNELLPLYCGVCDVEKEECLGNKIFMKIRFQHKPTLSCELPFPEWILNVNSEISFASYVKRRWFWFLPSRQLITILLVKELFQSFISNAVLIYYHCCLKVWTVLSERTLTPLEENERNEGKRKTIFQTNKDLDWSRVIFVDAWNYA